MHRLNLGRSSLSTTTVNYPVITPLTVRNERTKNSDIRETDSLRLGFRPLRPILGPVAHEALVLYLRTLVHPPGSLRHQAALTMTL